MTINPDEFTDEVSFEPYSAWGGTQLSHPNVLVTHTPTGMSARCSDTSSTLLNRSKCIAAIARRLDHDHFLETGNDLWQILRRVDLR